MKKLIINKWIEQGFSLKSLKIQKVLSFKKGIVELVNLKHGVITYLKVS